MALDYLQDIPLYSIVLMLLLSLASWLVESKKWQLLVRDVEEIRFRESVTQSLTAQAASFITPLRAGEFAFKALYFEKPQHRKILSRVFVGNLSQLIITIILGILGLLVFLNKDLNGVFFISFIVITLCCLIYILFLWIQKKWEIKEVSLKTWSTVMMFSLLRYVLFASNWLLILWTVKSETALISWIDNIAVNYFAVSVIPMFQIFDIPVRWTTASYIFNGSTYDDGHILIATTIVWGTNTLFPTLLGCVLLPFKKLKTV